MSDLLMPSDVQREQTAPGASGQANAPAAGGEGASPPIEPPSMKLIVRLFLIPLLIAIAVIAIMVPIGWMTDGPVSLETAIARLKNPGGERTMGLVGPASKQRYMDAKALVDHMKAGLTEEQRIHLAAELIQILEQHTKPDEGDVQHFLLLALGRVWQKYPDDPAMDSAAAHQSRQQTLGILTKSFSAASVPARKASILALAFWQGREEARRAIPLLIERVKDPREDLDVRIAAVVTLGNIAQASDENVMAALNDAMRETDPKNAELAWNAALSLAEFNRPEAKDTLLMLLSRDELAELKVFDREADPQNPVFRSLNDEEQQRFLMNAMERARKLEVPEVRRRLEEIAKNDPSQRVRMAATEMLAKK